MNSRVVILGIGAIALLAGCGSSSSGSAATQPTPVVPVASPTPTHSHTHTAAPTSTATATTTTTTTTKPASAGPCSSSHLTLSLGIGQGTAGTAYQVLVLTNTGSKKCTLFGYPGVSFVNSSGVIIGKPASRDHGAEHTITLRAGGAANALSRQPDAGNFSPSTCHMTTADRVRVYPPGQTAPLFAHDPIRVCSTSKGRTGIGPMLAGNGG